MRTVKAYPEHIRPFLAQITGAYRDDLMSMCERANVAPEDMLARNLTVSTDAFTCLDDGGIPIAMGGCVPTSIGTVMWMVAAMDKLGHHKKWMLRESREQIERIGHTYGKLVVQLGADADKSIKWLRWLGFEDAGPCSDAFGRKICQMERRA